MDWTCARTWIAGPTACMMRSPGPAALLSGSHAWRTMPCKSPWSATSRSAAAAPESAADLGEVLQANEHYTAQIEATARDLQAKLDTIERQQLAIAELSTPVLEIWTDVLALPIVGIVDTQRSVEMTERLLQAIVERQARCVIIDITGVDVVDTATADHFVKMVRAAAMLGAHCVVCGISPDVAQTLARIDVELTDVTTMRSLKDALTHCLAHIEALDRPRARRRASRPRLHREETES